MIILPDITSLVKVMQTDESIRMVPVGYVENEFHEPVFDEKMRSSVSRIIIKEEFKDGLYRIRDFDSLYILFYFHRSEGYGMIQKRMYDGELSGVFACRTPFRPNGIGLTKVTLLKVEDNIIHVKGLDAINGTPVIDIKPYISAKDDDKSDES